MGNIWFILKRDIKRLLRVPTALIVVVGLIFIPCLYAWFNIAGFWDPYQNTRNIKVAVANEDEGADSAVMGKLDLGSQLVDELRKNDQLGWTFLNRAAAMECVESGDCYSAVVIPRDFSKDMANVVTGTGDRPTLEYFVNEELTPVGAKISDTGADTLDRQVNSTFVSTVSSVVADTVNKANDQISAQSNTTVDQVGAQLDKTEANLAKTRSMIDELKDTLAQTSTKTDAAKAALDQAQSAAESAGSGLTQAGTLLGDTQSKLNGFIDETGKQFDDGAALFSRASGRATSDATRVANGLLTASGSASEALSELKMVNESNAQLLERLKALNASGVDSDRLSALLASLEQDNQKTAAALASATQLNDATSKAANGALDTIGQFGTTSTTTLDAINAARSKISTGSLPQLNSGLNSLAATSGTLGAAVSGQSQLVAQTKLVLDQVAQISEDTSSTLASTEDLLDTFANKIEDVNTDVKTLASTNVLKELTGSDGSLDAERIAKFMLSPTVLTTHTLYPIATYGSGMAPLFTSMALWVGVFMLMCLIRLEVDDEGLEGRMVTPGQKYVARFLLLAMVATCQAIAATVGDLVIGVQTVNRFMFILTAILASWSYLSIGYALSTMFMHVGKGLVVALVIVQIPGASGLYPIEMMPKFFRVLYPFFPFTYTITAFRETIGGFCDGTWIKMILMLALFAAISFFCGLVIRPLMANLNSLFAREVAETDMLAGEPVSSTSRRASLGQILHVLADKGGYRRQIEERAQRFARLYPRLLRGAVIAGIVVPAALAITFSLTDGTKLVALATWIVWILAIILFLMVVEYIRDSLRRQAQLGTLTDDSLREMLLSNGRVQRAAARHGLTGRLATAARQAGAASDTDDDEDGDDETSAPEAASVTHLRHLQDTLALDLRGIRSHLPQAHHGRHEDGSRPEGHRWSWGKRQHGRHEDDAPTAAIDPAAGTTDEGGQQA
ncbi:YhgE/Pip domain-containing protein [Bifidobacterium cuniculi]|uniref:Phage infection protein n=1 Tax=Bifidobacterium cuniculi TaxID=1688 RepID=A0A087B2M0_9BIFI|nr:YhgE/Pip domain-containing protein [Bifidobacterium cuniculi]KFI65270.1 phage infection protein [Bifidobacterium cuniculi]